MSLRVIVVHQLPKHTRTKPIRDAVTAAMERFKKSGEVVVKLGDANELQALNKQFRGQDRTTDVLTFPAPETAGYWGDIVISLDHAQAQARLRGVRMIDEAAMLAVHGCLHLLGFDDHTEEERIEMVRLQNEILTSIHLPSDEQWQSIPYEEFAP